VSKEFFIYPYSADSASAKALSEELDCYRINLVNSQFRGAPHKVIINWGHGNSLPDEVFRCPNILNKPDNVRKAVNKIKTFEAFDDAMVRCPLWTTHIETARGWYLSGYNVYCRQRVEGCDGAGLVVVNSDTDPVTDIVPAKLYTQGIRFSNTHGDEYRVNVFQDQAVSYQKKVSRADRAHNANRWARTTEGGWCFEVAEERNVPPQVDSEAIAAVKALGLDFGGVDVVYSRWNTKAYVLEVNTAPELTPHACTKLGNALKEYLRELG
jgi:glutathione synthase/RimK-type ligase-like ATP-grasp enzyme